MSDCGENTLLGMTEKDLERCDKTAIPYQDHGTLYRKVLNESEACAGASFDLHKVDLRLVPLEQGHLGGLDHDVEPALRSQRKKPKFRDFYSRKEGKIPKRVSASKKKFRAPALRNKPQVRDNDVLEEWLTVLSKSPSYECLSEYSTASTIQGQGVAIEDSVLGTPDPFQQRALEIRCHPPDENRAEETLWQPSALYSVLDSMTNDPMIEEQNTPDLPHASSDWLSSTQAQPSATSSGTWQELDFRVSIDEQPIPLQLESQLDSSHASNLWQDEHTPDYWDAVDDTPCDSTCQDEYSFSPVETSAKHSADAVFLQAVGGQF